jgi:hypothetical protein
MTRVQVEQISLQVTDETSVGVAGTTWHQLEPDNITSSGSDISTVSRRPISKNRQEQEGIVTNLEAAIEYETDVTMSMLDRFIDKFLYCQFSSWDLIFIAAPVLTTGFTIASATANQAGKLVFNVNGGEASLVYSRGQASAVNNGLFALTGDVSATDLLIPVAGQGLVVDASPPINARLEIAGLRAAASDMQLVVSGSTATLTSTADVTDWEDYGLIRYQEVYLGGLTSAERFATGHDFARVASFDGAVLNLDKIGPNLATDTGAGITLDIMFGQFARNVAVDDDTDGRRFQESTQQFEIAYPRSGTTTMFEYNIGSSANQLAINIPLNDKVNATVGYVCTNADDVTTTRKSGANAPITPISRAAFGTGADIANLRTSAIGSNDAVCFKSLTVTFNNNAAAENCLGTLGAVAVNVGIFQMTIEAQAWFTGLDITNAIKNNVTVTMDWQMKNRDGAVAFDVPSLKLGGGGKEFPRDQTVLINTTAQAFEDATSATSIGVSLFPVVPLS